MLEVYERSDLVLQPSKFLNVQLIVKQVEVTCYYLMDGDFTSASFYSLA